MLFYGFKVDCEYTGQYTLAKAFEQSRSQRCRAVSDINDALYEEGNKERYTILPDIVKSI